MAANAKVAGVVRSSTENATITIDQNANVNGDFILGGVVPSMGSPEQVNISVYKSPLRFSNGSSFTNVVAGKKYKSTGESNEISDTITMAYKTNGATDKGDTQVEESEKDTYNVTFYETQMNRVVTDASYGASYNKYEWYKKSVTIKITTIAFVNDDVE